MKIAILGFNLEGQSSYEYFARQGHDLVIHDQNPEVEVPAGARAVLGEAYLDALEQYDLIVRTAGLPPHLILENNPDVADKITTNLNEFLINSPSRNIIGVTGTKGKGTTSTLTARMLEAGGHKVFLGGNIGLPPLSFIDQVDPDDWIVLEVSSFQAIDLQASPHIGVCLMIVAEHLNWHADMDEYWRAKANLFAYQTGNNTAIYLSGSKYSKDIAAAGNARLMPYYEVPGAVVRDGHIMVEGEIICDTSELKLLGEHNWQNVCAALTAAWQVTQDREGVRSVLTTFSGLTHRLELVREVDGVRYYDDSFGTTPETAIVAIKAFGQPKVVILGGADKGANYDELARTITQSNIRKALLIGEQAGRIQASLDRAGFKNYMPGGNNMSEIVLTIKQLAQPGDIVLLSPACTSFDMFVDYKDRGEQFKAAVQALA